MCDQHDAAVAERRKSTRYPKDRDTDFAVIGRSEGEEILVEVHDESLGGLAVYMHDVTGFEVGQELTVVYQGTSMRATVRHIEPQSDGDFVMGLKCDEMSSS